MNIHGISQSQVVGPGQGIPVGIQQNSPQQQAQIGMVAQNPQQSMQQQQPEKIDNISKVKGLIGPLKESLAMTLKASALLLQQNNLTDIGTRKGIDPSQSPPRFDKPLEEFYSICDQIELHIKTAVQCMNQSTSSQHYLPNPVATTRMETMMQNENFLSYPQYLNTVRSQISYAKEIHDTLICAAQNISPSE